jgi:hypothetical protein
MNFDKLVEEKIREGMENGEFDNLKGQFEPINLDDYFSCPPELRAGYAVMKNAKVIPLEMELLKEVGDLREKVRACHEPERKRKLEAALNHAQLKYNLQMDAYRRRR